MCVRVYVCVSVRFIHTPSLLHSFTPSLLHSLTSSLLPSFTHSHSLNARVPGPLQQTGSGSPLSTSCFPVAWFCSYSRMGMMAHRPCTTRALTMSEWSERRSCQEESDTNGAVRRSSNTSFSPSPPPPLVCFDLEGKRGCAWQDGGDFTPLPSRGSLVDRLGGPVVLPDRGGGQTSTTNHKRTHTYIHTYIHIHARRTQARTQDEKQQEALPARETPPHTPHLPPLAAGGACAQHNAHSNTPLVCSTIAAPCILHGSRL